MNTVSPIEKAEIEKDLGAQEIGYIEKLRVSDIPVKDIITNRCFVALILTGFCISIVDFVVINMVPTVRCIIMIVHLSFASQFYYFRR